MAGTEIFGKEEIMAAADVIERRMIHRYGSHAERAGVYRAEEFEAAEKAGKRVVMFLGTRYSLEDCLEDFLSIMENLYPEEEWVHIYKGHPGDTYQSGRSAMLRDHGIAEVDASIPAEIYCFFEPETASESLFAYLADAHENIFAIKGDGATKEDMVWGFRIGFVTYASKGLDKAQLAALENKTLGMIRCTVSNCDRPGQSMLVHAYREGENVQADKARTFEEMRRRYRRIHQAIASHPQTLLRAYPFNSGYFMAFDTTGHSAEQLRRHLLDDYGIGTVNIMDRTLRLAYCSVEEESLEDLVDKVYKAAEELWS